MLISAPEESPFTENIFPIDDGIKHINIYSKSNCKLGRDLSNFSNYSFNHPVYGNFACMEGFWYYVATGFSHEQLRVLTGIHAKRFGMKQTKIIMKETIFKEIMKSGLLARLEQNPILAYDLRKSTLPLIHYYYFGNINNCKVVVPKDSLWLVDFYTEYREKYAIR